MGMLVPYGPGQEPNQEGSVMFADFMIEKRWMAAMDRFGVSWQVVPSSLDEMLRKGSREQVAAVTQAFLPMKKFDVAALQMAYEGAMAT